jgi:3-oxoacyl-[acyl-carrier protein] reductase
MGVLEGRAAIVTAGGGPGMGQAICRALAAEGAAVAVNDIDAARAEKVAADICAAGGHAIAVPADVSDADAVEEMARRTLEAFGSIGILVHHAGVWPGGPLEKITEDVFDRTLAVHLKGAFLASRAVVPHMRANHWGRIVCTSSRGAYRHSGAQGISDYAAAKAGVVGFSRALALEVGEWGITVNVVAPGQVSGTGMLADRPPLTPEEEARLGQAEGQVLPPRHVRPDEIAGAVLYLVGPYSERVTGTVLHVNGGSYFPA